MPTVSVASIMEAADRIRNTWMSNPTFAIGDLTFNQFMSIHNEMTSMDSTVEAKRDELQGLIDARNGKAEELKELNNRALSGFRAIYGSDSPQFDQARGTRSGKRQARRHLGSKAETATVASTQSP